MHRDIKLDNLIYEHEGEDAELKLIDFGFACEARTQCGIMRVCSVSQTGLGQLGVTAAGVHV